MTVVEIRADLIAEQAALDAIVASLSPEAWATPTASPRWSVADQIAHLTFFDQAAVTAISDPAAFAHAMKALRDAPLVGGVRSDDVMLGEFRGSEAANGTDLLIAWRNHRNGLAAAALSLRDGDRVAWYGPSMGAKSFLTARLMECWAHGQDIVDAVGAHREATSRLRHIAQLGFITRGWSYVNRGRAVPESSVALDLEAPDGTRWTFGPDDADDLVRGPALDFCLVVTQRRHRADAELTFGPIAEEWLDIAQAFAGGATDGPPPTR